MMLIQSKPNMILFSTTLMLSTLILLTTSNWIVMWAMFEMNMMSIIPMITINQKSYELEASIKYFLIQAISSSILLMSIVLLISSTYIEGPTWGILFAILTKMGSAPCHMWVPPVMSNSSWFMLLTLSTWQKLPPICILSSLSTLWSQNVFTSIIMLNAMIGAIGGVNQTQMRSLLAYSSIAHMGWMITAIMISSSLIKIYFFLYSLTMILIINSIIKINSHLSFNLNSSMSTYPKIMNLVFLYILSLGGLPPLLGFFPKWMVLKTSIYFSLTIPCSLILSSLISLFYYLNIFIASQLPLKNLILHVPNIPLTFMLSAFMLPVPFLLLMS